MSLEKTIIARLSFIKHLYNLAVELSEKPEQLCTASLLTFHDSIEMFLALTAEHLNVGPDELGKKGNRVTFMDYWEIIPKSKIKPNIPLKQKVSMERLNTARNNFKHKGLMFSKSEIEVHRASATNFFSQNMPLIFDIEFADLSLIDLILFDRARQTLKEAQEQLKQNKIEESLRSIAIAFDQLISDYESTKKGIIGKSPFHSGKESESMQDMQEALKIISLGIDYRKYSKFRLHTPIIHETTGGRYYCYFTKKKLPTVQDIQFCIDFIIESAIILQEFDYSVEHQKQ